MKRLPRILLNVFLPPLVAALCFSAGIFGASIIEYVKIPSSPFAKLFADAGSYSLMILVYSYYLAIVPSLLHAGLMELVYRKHAAHSWSAVGFSSLSGFFSGLLIGSFFLVPIGGMSSAQFLGAVLWSGLGLLVGFLVGLIIKKLASRCLARNAALSASVSV